MELNHHQVNYMIKKLGLYAAPYSGNYPVDQYIYKTREDWLSNREPIFRICWHYDCNRQEDYGYILLEPKGRRVLEDRIRKDEIKGGAAFVTVFVPEV